MNLHSKSLTEMFHLLNQNDFSLDYIFKPDFMEYLLNLDAPNFVSNVFVYGFEIRDADQGELVNECSQLIETIEECYEHKFKEEVEANDYLLTQYNLGLINIYLYFCQREQPLTGKPSINTDLYVSDYVEVKDTTENDPSKTANINQAINYLKKATKLADTTINIAKGIYLYHTIRVFNYIFEVFMNYSVDNNNKPIDLDSFYVFSDALDSDVLWLELMRQNKNKLEKKGL